MIIRVILVFALICKNSKQHFSTWVTLLKLQLKFIFPQKYVAEQSDNRCPICEKCKNFVETICEKEICAEQICEKTICEKEICDKQVFEEKIVDEVLTTKEKAHKFLVDDWKTSAKSNENFIDLRVRDTN